MNLMLKPTNCLLISHMHMMGLEGVESVMLGIPHKLERLTKITLKNTIGKVKIEGGVSNGFTGKQVEARRCILHVAVELAPGKSL